MASFLLCPLVLNVGQNGGSKQVSEGSCGFYGRISVLEGLKYHAAANVSGTSEDAMEKTGFGLDIFRVSGLKEKWLGVARIF
jgi:hypothetical protein